jgi:glutamate racemase
MKHLRAALQKIMPEAVPLLSAIEQDMAEAEQAMDQRAAEQRARHEAFRAESRARRQRILDEDWQR